MKPYYQDSAVTIYHGDCREILPEIHFDVLYTDPPYGINYDPGWLSDIHIAKGTKPNKSDDRLYADDGTLDVSFLFAYPMRLIWGFPYIYDPKATGWLVWDKQPRINWRGMTAPVEIASTTLRKGYDLVHCMWAGFLRDTQEEEVRSDHPTQKPIKVVRGSIERYVKDTKNSIMDPFMGSGTTLRAAKDLGRKAIGIEIEEKYCEIAAKRMAQEVLNFT